MDKYLTCKQVEFLMKFYIEKKLNSVLYEYVKLHLNNCAECRSKYEALKPSNAKIYSQTHAEGKDVCTSQRSYIQNLSAYVDNELSSEDNIKIKKMTISSPVARKDLETMYSLKRILQASFNKTKMGLKFDFSRNILSKVYNEEYYVTTAFERICLLFIVIIFSIICGFVYLYF